MTAMDDGSDWGVVAGFGDDYEDAAPPLLPAPTPPSPEYGAQPQLQPVRPPAHHAPSGPRVPGPPESPSYCAPGGANDVYRPPMVAPPGPMPGRPIPHIEAVGEPPNEGGHMLGLSLLAVAAGAAFGMHRGGAVGAGAGILLAGAAVNAVRSVSRFKEGTEEDDHEGRVSALYSAIGVAGGGYLWAKYVDPALLQPNPDEPGAAEPALDVDLGDDDDYDVVATEYCGIRRVGP